MEKKNIQNRSLTAFELQNLFRSILNQDQIKYISKIIKALGQYMVLDREMLDIRCDDRIGLSYIRKAVEYGLVTEYQYQNEQYTPGVTYPKRFYFQLNTAGITFLDTIKYKANVLRLDTVKEEREQILAFNRYAIDKGYEINMGYAVIEYSWFVCKQDTKNIFCYFPNLISKEILSRKIFNLLYESSKEPTQEEIKMMLEQKFSFEEIVIVEQCDFGNKTSGNTCSCITEN